MGIWPFRASSAERTAEKVLAAVTAASRQPGWYGEGKLPDTLEGRFEAMAVNATLALIGLRETPEVAQIFTDAVFSQFDAGLREAGVGDLTVPKRMRKLAGEFYGRLDAYGRALQGAPGELEDAIRRNMAVAAPFAGRLAAHLRTTAAAQQDAGPEAVAHPSNWPLFAG